MELCCYNSLKTSLLKHLTVACRSITLRYSCWDNWLPCFPSISTNAHYPRLHSDSSSLRSLWGVLFLSSFPTFRWLYSLLCSDSYPTGQFRYIPQTTGWDWPEWSDGYQDNCQVLIPLLNNSVVCTNPLCQPCDLDTTTHPSHSSSVLDSSVQRTKLSLFFVAFYSACSSSWIITLPPRLWWLSGNVSYLYHLLLRNSSRIDSSIPLTYTPSHLPVASLSLQLKCWAS